MKTALEIFQKDSARYSEFLRGMESVKQEIAEECFRIAQQAISKSKEACLIVTGIEFHLSLHSIGDSPVTGTAKINLLRHIQEAQAAQKNQQENQK